MNITSLTDNHVICGGSRILKHHPGNQRYNNIIKQYLFEYQRASKKQRSIIISTVIDIIQFNSGYGGFVQKDPVAQQYVLVSDHRVRERTAQAFRDALHRQYRSSKISKKIRLNEKSKTDQKSICHNLDVVTGVSLDTFERHSFSITTCPTTVLQQNAVSTTNNTIGSSENILDTTNIMYNLLRKEEECTEDEAMFISMLQFDEDDDDDELIWRDLCHCIHDVPTASFLCESALDEETDFVNGNY